MWKSLEKYGYVASVLVKMFLGESMKLKMNSFHYEMHSYTLRNDLLKTIAIMTSQTQNFPIF